MTGAENNTKAVSRRGDMVVAWIKVMAMYKFKTHSRYKSVGLGDCGYGVEGERKMKMTCPIRQKVVSLAKIGNIKGGPGLGTYYEDLGYVETPLSNGEIQQELARWRWSSDVQVQKKKCKDQDIEILANEQKFFGKE